ncbi:MAG TPA: hypothetical protein VEV15_06000, partial [Flavisolibacter sp.]|nr:hypothetical protein [Flavisolibacter sp.]
VVRPVTLTEFMVYSFGTLAFCRARRSGSTEVTVVSWECDVVAMKAQKNKEKIPDKYRCI